MISLATYIRIGILSPTDSDVESRQKAIASLATKWQKLTKPNEILSKVADIADALIGEGLESEGLSKEVESAIQKVSASYVRDERPLEIGVCAAIAAASILAHKPGKYGWTSIDVYSNALWLALDFQSPLAHDKQESLRRELLNMAAQRSVEGANKARERDVVPEPKTLTIEADDDGNVVPALQTALTDLVVPLTRNALLDREELDFLWWALLDHSRLLKRRLNDLEEPVRHLAMGLEGALLLRRFPADVHRELIARGTSDEATLELQELLDVVEPYRHLLATKIPATVTAMPTIYPLANALVSGSAPSHSSALKRSPSAWGARILLEATMAKLASQGLPQQ